MKTYTFTIHGIQTATPEGAKEIADMLADALLDQGFIFTSIKAEEA